MKKILERPADYDAKRPALPWALAIAGWECRTLHRTQKRRREDPEQAVGGTGHVDVEADILARDLAQAAVAALGPNAIATR